ncbi:hypothetical protein [Parablautia muri]|uniref:Lipoprotein n=1 Tax=Parablautia muri TaxID=2320879 RepID=A0A9X5GQA2_9FIRM|nr:hypothetical protein [Parablautia muri]NBJ91943.1 hypothetical protein [Parablautia muri]
MKLKKAMILLGTVCILHTMVTGCGSSPVAKTEENQTYEALSEELNDAPPKGIDGNTDGLQENTAGKWQILEPDVAAVVDADFLGKIWKLEEDSFFIAEKKVKILDDGSLSYSSPSSNADLPDSQLIHVILEDDTRFYSKTTDGNGESYEDKEAEFQDLKVHMSVEMKGSFKNDEFYATEIRFF